LIFSAVAISSSASPFLALLRAQYAEHMIGEEIAGIGLEYLPVQAFGFCETVPPGDIRQPDYRAFVNSFKTIHVQSAGAGSEHCAADHRHIAHTLQVPKKNGGHPLGWPPQIFDSASF